jgi:hypothetical protein
MPVEVRGSSEGLGLTRGAAAWRVQVSPILGVIAGLRDQEKRVSVPGCLPMERAPPRVRRLLVGESWNLIVDKANIRERYVMSYELSLEGKDDRGEGGPAPSGLLPLKALPDASVALDVVLEFGDKALQALLVRADAASHLAVKGVDGPCCTGGSCVRPNV